jgi:hypothetical protein
MKVLSASLIFQMPMREEQMKRILVVRDSSIVALAFLALAPKSQEPDFALSYKGDRGPPRIPVEMSSRRLELVDQKYQPPKQSFKDRHSFHKGQIPRRRTGRNR